MNCIYNKNNICLKLLELFGLKHCCLLKNINSCLYYKKKE